MAPNSSFRQGTLRLGFAGLPDTPELHVSVDGMTPRGPNLSHWPGNRTPPVWKADLSTGICLNFARAQPFEQRRFLADATVVLNDHYDTDGLGSLLAMLRPEVAFAYEELVLAAAATGDFGVFVTPRAFAIDRIVARLAKPESPVAGDFAALSGAELGLARYHFLLEHAAEVFDAPETFAPLYADELAQVRAAIDAGLRGGLVRRHHDLIGLTVVESKTPVHRMVLNTLAAAYRVLHIERTGDGALVRYHDRTESWFELVTIRAPRRRDLRPLAARLDALEPEHHGARWCADPPTEPIPELYFGEPAAQEYGQLTRTLRPSRLDPTTLEREVREYFAAPTAQT